MLARARMYLGRLHRRHVWRQELDRYQQLPEADRGYDVADPSRPGRPPDRDPRREPVGCLRTALDQPPAFERRPLSLATPGGHWFLSRQRHRLAVDIPAELVLERPAGHDLDAPLGGGGRPLVITQAELLETARWMDSTLRAAGLGGQARWERRSVVSPYATRDRAARGRAGRRCAWTGCCTLPGWSAPARAPCGTWWPCGRPGTACGAPSWSATSPRCCA